MEFFIEILLKYLFNLIQSKIPKWYQKLHFNLKHKMTWSKPAHTNTLKSHTIYLTMCKVKMRTSWSRTTRIKNLRITQTPANHTLSLFVIDIPKHKKQKNRVGILYLLSDGVILRVNAYIFMFQYITSCTLLWHTQAKCDIWYNRNHITTLSYTKYNTRLKRMALSETLFCKISNFLDIQSS